MLNDNGSKGIIKIIDIGSDARISDDIMDEKCVVCGKRRADVYWADMDAYYECKWCYGFWRYVLLMIKTTFKIVTFRYKK